jgi:hypothetical protein
MSSLHKISLCFLSVLALFNGTTNRASVDESKEYEVMLPVNTALPEGARLGLHMKVALKFQPVQESPTAPSITFVLPGNDSNWSEVISVQTLPGAHGDAHQFLADAKKMYFNHNYIQDIRIVTESTQDCVQYKKATFAVSYCSQGNKILSVNLFYGTPADNSIISYSIMLSDELSEEHALEKVETFIKEKTAIVRF